MSPIPNDLLRQHFHLYFRLDRISSDFIEKVLESAHFFVTKVSFSQKRYVNALLKAVQKEEEELKVLFEFSKALSVNRNTSRMEVF
jgi:Cft2 family RNA processing exonuclease